MQIVERADEGEDDALGQVMFDAIHRGRSLYTPAERRAWLPAPYAGVKWRAKLARQRVFVARIADRPVGFLTLEGGYINLAFVAPQAQGQGVFAALYRHAEATAKGHLRLTTHASLMAQPAFLAQGFRVIRHETVARGDQHLVRAEMEKDLS